MSLTTFLIVMMMISPLIVWIIKEIEADKISYRKKPAMTPVERKLYYTIREAIRGEKAILLAQVSMTSIMAWEKSRKNTAFNRISRKSIDFVICDHDGNPLIAIELQDRTHERIDRKKSDKTKAEALRSAGIPFIEFWARTLPNVATVKNKLEPFIEHTRSA